ncbi:MAG: hypothetical protein R3B13_37115 [Polyangiaceae bacterium]
MSQTRMLVDRLRRVLAPAVAGLGVLMALSCSSEAVCDGVEINGQCEKPCDETKCAVTGSICFANACSAPCNGHEFCPDTQNCGTIQFKDGNQGNYCYTPAFAAKGLNGKFVPCATNDDCDQARGYQCLGDICSPPCTTHSDCVQYDGYCKTDANGVSFCVQSSDPPPGQSGACTSSAECDQHGGYKCVDSECRLAGCRTHTDCASVGLCKPGKLDDGTTTTACFKDTVHPAGQYGTRCTEKDDADCDEANGFVCIGAGIGDADAYCTQKACNADSACPTGYFCSQVRSGRLPCEATCPGIDPAPTDPTCIKAADIGAGKEYSCGSINLLRSLCLKREYCNECETDVDCLALPDQVCAKDSKGKKRCTTVCDPNVPSSCPWGTASLCSVTDTSLNVPTCSHRFGTCEATGKGCEPCIDDSDCPTGLCISSDFTQERYCLDLAVTCDCTGVALDQQKTYCLGGGCPKTPGGLNMRCFGGSAVPDTSLLKNKCFGAQIVQQFGGSPQTACWPK